MLDRDQIEVDCTEDLYDRSLKVCASVGVFATRAVDGREIRNARDPADVADILEAEGAEAKSKVWATIYGEVAAELESIRDELIERPRGTFAAMERLDALLEKLR